MIESGLAPIWRRALARAFSVLTVVVALVTGYASAGVTTLVGEGRPFYIALVADLILAPTLSAFAVWRRWWRVGTAMAFAMGSMIGGAVAVVMYSAVVGLSNVS